MESVTDTRVRALIETLGLVAHPEGGYYAEIAAAVAPASPEVEPWF